MSIIDRPDHPASNVIPALLSLPEAAAVLGFGADSRGVRRLRTLLSRGDLITVKLGRYTMVRADSIADLIERSSYRGSPSNPTPVLSSTDRGPAISARGVNS